MLAPLKNINFDQHWCLWFKLQTLANKQVLWVIIVIFLYYYVIITIVIVIIVYAYPQIGIILTRFKDPNFYLNFNVIFMNLKLINWYFTILNKYYYLNTLFWYMINIKKVKTSKDKKPLGIIKKSKAWYCD